ncbi:hypothetical protein DAPPUDRAFT_274251, partial [Daphnia pulex]
MTRHSEAATPEPDLSEIAEDWRWCVDQRDSRVYTRIKNNINRRTCWWPGQTDDGRRWSKRGNDKDVFPWPGAADTRVHLVDLYVKSDAAMLMTVWRRNKIVVQGTEVDDSRRASKMTQLLRWLRYTQMREYPSESRLLANYFLERGAAVQGLWWTTETESPESQATLEQDGQAQETETSQGQATDPEPSTAGSSLDQEILAAIREAGAAPDRATAIAKMAKRIQGLVDDRDAERNRRLELERAGQAKPQGQQDSAPAQAGPIVHPKLATLDAEIQTIQAGLRTIRANRDGYTAKNEDGSDGRSFTADELEEIRVENEARLAELSAERRMTQREIEQEEQTQRETATAEAQRQYPWINQRDSQEYQLAISELRQLGPVAQQLKNSPQFALIVGR